MQKDARFQVVLRPVFLFQGKFMVKTVEGKSTCREFIKLNFGELRKFSNSHDLDVKQSFHNFYL